MCVLEAYVLDLSSRLPSFDWESICEEKIWRGIGEWNATRISVAMTSRRPDGLRRTHLLLSPPLVLLDSPIPHLLKEIMAFILKLSYLALASFSWTSAQKHDQIPIVASLPSSIPLLGFGTWNLKISSSNTSAAVATALRAGYVHLDCAAIYGNEKDVGQGIKDGLEAAELKREDIWITSKLWNDQ